MRKQRLLVPLTGAFSLLGLALRQLQLRTGFDAAGLPIPGAVINLAVPACSAAFLILAALFLLGMKGKAAALTYDKAFRCENNTGYMMVTVFCAALLICGLLLSCLAYVRHELPNLLHLILGVLMAASGCCLVMLGRNNYRALGQGKFSGSLLLPAYTCAFWLILSYQQVSGSPILQSYIYRLLAIIFTLLAFYFMAGFSFEKGKPLVTAWTSLCTIYFTCVALLDERNWITIAYMAAFLLYFTVHSVTLLDNITAEREDSTDE